MIIKCACCEDIKWCCI